MVTVFKRAAWKRNKDWPGGYEPYVGPKRHVCYANDVTEARRICKLHNDDRKRKDEPFCEFEGS